MSLGTRLHQTLLPGRSRPLDAIGRERVMALLLAGRKDAAVRAYQESTRASYRRASKAVTRLRQSLPTPAGYWWNSTQRPREHPAEAAR